MTSERTFNMKKFNNYAASLIFTILTAFFIIFTVFVRFAGTTVMNEKFYTRLPQHGIEFPFPQMDVHLTKV